MALLTHQPAPTTPAPIQARLHASSGTDSARRAGGPEDRALYTCGCGCAFKASVSTSVGCPNCGAAQAW